MFSGRKTYFPLENMVVPQGNLSDVSFGNMVVSREQLKPLFTSKKISSISFVTDKNYS
jgi:hypothetical protein